MNIFYEYSQITYRKVFLFFLIIILSINSYLIYAIKLDSLVQILSLLLSFGVFIYFKDSKIYRKKINNIQDNLLSFFIFFITLYRSLWIFNDNDKFIYLLLPLLLISLILNFYSLKDVFFNYKPILISLLLALKEILFIPLSLILTPISTFFTWFFLNMSGYKAIVKGSEIFYSSGGINITFSCSGSDQLLFCLSAMLVLNLCFPLKNKVVFLKQIVLTILFALIVNIIRLSILAIFVDSANSQGFSIFDYMHGGNGSFIFSLVSMIFCCESYKKAYFKT